MRMIVIGSGRMGAGLAQTLNLRGHDVTVIDKDPQAFERLGSGFKGKTVLGVGFDRDVLLAAGIQRADGLAAVMASDEANVVAARLARHVFHVPRVVARLYDPRKADIYRRLGLQTISPVSWGIDRVADLLCYSSHEPVASLGSGQVDLLEVEIPPALIGRTVNDLTVPGEVHVVALSRGAQTFLPTRGTSFQAGDVAYLAVLDASSERLADLLGRR